MFDYEVVGKRGTKMGDNSSGDSRTPFPSIQSDMLNRLSEEAEQRTMKPQVVDWAEIHRQAAEARKKAG